jgi:hypothetical protein
MSEQLYDVVAVDMHKNTVKLMGRKLDTRNAEANVEMYVIRRGVLSEFYVKVPHGKFKDGDIYTN